MLSVAETSRPVKLVKSEGRIWRFVRSTLKIGPMKLPGMPLIPTIRIMFNDAKTSTKGMVPHKIFDRLKIHGCLLKSRGFGMESVVGKVLKYFNVGGRFRDERVQDVRGVVD